jgi:23S rRNA (guanosine2251-2'-O)-methyltransferase
MRYHRPGHRPHSSSNALRQDEGAQVICGLNAVQEALRVGARRLETIWIAEGKAGKRLQEALNLAAAHGTSVEIVPQTRLAALAGTSSHQGVIAFVAQSPLLTLDHLITQLTTRHPIPPLAILDGVKDPRNLGAIIRSAAAFGIGGIVLPGRRAVGITATAAKAASGGLEYVPIAEVTNLSQSIECLKRRGFWVVGADEQAEISCHLFAYPSPLALVFGEEGMGMHSLVKRSCDALVSIPVRGPLRSLNVAVAAAVLFYEVMGRASEGGGAAAEPLPKTSSL